jgi:glycosyltransferase involved in cell wall biosynthesis
MGKSDLREIAPKVVHVFPGCRPGGGPAGYCFNLLQALTLLDSKESLKVLYPNTNTRRTSKVSRKFDLLKSLPTCLSGFLVFVRTLMILRDAFRYFGFTEEQMDEITISDVVVFHDYRLASTYLLNSNRPSNQKIIIMPHAPTDLSAEMIDNLRLYLGNSFIWNIIYSYMAKIELKTLVSSNCLLIPCRDSLEGYFTSTPERVSLFHLPFYELPSGVRPLKATRSSHEVRTSWGVDSKKIVGFFGRRHPHKGYDIFCQAAEVAYRHKIDIVFVSAGSGPISPPLHLPNFLDLGHLTTEELANAIAAVDLVIVPNRFCYFDLIILEAMSLGKPVLTTPVGGSRCLNSPGIFFVNNQNAESLMVAINELLLKRDLEEVGKLNLEVFEKMYGLQPFARRHLEFARLIKEML